MFKPFWITAMIREPISVPKMRPSPPARLVPPTTTAAITCSSYIMPALGRPPLNRAASTMPLNPDSPPHRAYTRISTPNTGTPDSRAASALPPTA